MEKPVSEYLENLRSIKNRIKAIESGDKTVICRSVPGYLDPESNNPEIERMTLFYNCNGNLDRYNQIQIDSYLAKLNDWKKDIVKELRELQEFIKIDLGE